MDTENFYLLIKSLHVIAVISWLAGLLYVPRLFVYHSRANRGSDLDNTFQTMERKLLNYITTPAMIAAVLLGLTLAYLIGFDYTWLHIKITLVLILIGFHLFLIKCRKNFASGKNIYSEKFFRIINEVPTLIMILVIFLVIFKPYE